MLRKWLCLLSHFSGLNSMRFSLLLFSLFLLSTTSVDDLNSARVYFQSGRESKSSAEKLLKLSNVASSIRANFITNGKMAIAIPSNSPKNTTRRNIEIFFPEKNATPKPNSIKRVMCGLIK